MAKSGTEKKQVQPELSEETKEALKAGEELTKVILNKGGRSYITSRGRLAPNGSIELPLAEAESLMGYEGLIDASKYTQVLPPDVVEMKAQIANLLKENAALKAENEKLRG